MKKFIILMVIGFFAYQYNYGQRIAYYDAKYFRDVIMSNNGKFHLQDIKPSLQDYYFGKNMTDKRLDSLVRLNPFLNSYYERGVQGALTSIQLPNLASQLIPGSNITNFADGLAKFLVDRFKEEISASFFEKFKNDINDPKYADLKILFPETWKTLNVIDKDIYKYSIYLNTLRQSFIKDFSNQYKNLQILLDQPKYRDYFKKENPELGSILNSALYFINEFTAGKHPGTVLAGFNSASKINLKDSVIQTNIRNAIQTIQLFSENLRSVSDSNYWVPADSVVNLVMDSVTFRIFLGLIYQKSEPLEFRLEGNKHLKFKTILTKLSQNIDSLYEYENFIVSFIDHSQEVDDYIKKLRSQKKSDIDPNDYYILFESSLDLLDYATSFIDLPYVNLGSKIETRTKNMSSNVLFITRTSGELYVDIRTKNYSSAIVNTLSILDTLLSKRISGDLRKRIMKYGSFMASIAQAQNSDDVKSVIESVALPAGSYSIKQKTYLSLSVNGYMGYGWDFHSNELYMKGIYAPLGLAFSRGAIGKKYGGGAFVAFISIIDIGGLTAFRLENETDTLKQNIKLQSIISPSVQILYEIPRTPLNICFGWRMTPSLFYSGHETFKTVESVSAFNLSVLIDIPIFTIKTFDKKMRP
jgi:hypothetical protein